MDNKSIAKGKAFAHTIPSKATMQKQKSHGDVVHISFTDEPQTPTKPVVAKDKTSNTPTNATKRKVENVENNKTQGGLRKRRTRKKLNLA